MLLTRSLPQQFLLPVWGTPKLYQALQRAYKSEGAFDGGKRPQKGKKRSRTPLSLFDELFPEEKRKEDLKGEEVEDRLPLFEWDVENAPAKASSPSPGAQVSGKGAKHEPRSTDKAASRWNESTRIKLLQETDREVKRLRREASVLILRCASKTLEESDFFRVSPRGEHLEGWTRGIIQVIQSRDSHTLEPLGTYFIIFSSDIAARAYLDQTVRLHKLARLNSGSLQSFAVPPPPGFLREGEDLKTALRKFSLIPSHSKLSMSLANRPLRPSIIQMLDVGGLPSMANLQGKGEGMVMVSVEPGQISRFDLKEAISDDGKRRNLHWELAEDGITGFASNHQDSVPQELLGDESLAAKQAHRGSSRHVLSFKDRYEARRFVREWHRRPFPTNRETCPGDELPRIVNAEIIW